MPLQEFYIQATVSGKTETYTGQSEPTLKSIMAIYYPSRMKMQTPPTYANMFGPLRIKNF